MTIPPLPKYSVLLDDQMYAGDVTFTGAHLGGGGGHFFSPPLGIHQALCQLILHISLRTVGFQARPPPPTPYFLEPQSCPFLKHFQNTALLHTGC